MLKERCHNDIFFKNQTRIALNNCGIIDPESLAEYRMRDGYLGLATVLTDMTPEDVISAIRTSGLRGRGGGGFTSAIKWQFTKDALSDVKYVICNADEGDPGAFMDRSTIEGDPHAILEGMAIAGYAVGASRGFIYIRAEYPLAIKRLNKAIDDARHSNLIGHHILGTTFSFDIELRLGAGAFVCGEETALINSIEGNRGIPKPRPPYPAVKGVFGKPTVINNVETFSNVPAIIRNGAEAFAKLGTEKSKGTKVFALAGAVNNTGLVEVEMGTTLRQIIFEMGGGIKNGRAFKAAQTGGPSGGCLPSQYLDTPVDYDSLMAAGSIMGSGGLIVMDDTSCMVDVAKFFIQFTQDESCGKCTPCREGTKRMLEILTRITEGNGQPEDIDRLEKLANVIKNTSLCGLGQSAPNPVLSTIKQFRQEYEQHIHEKKCVAGRCEKLISYRITEACIGCTACARVCPAGCISGSAKAQHVIDVTKCIKCDSCFQKCKFNAITKG